MARKSSQEPLWVTNDELNTKCSVSGTWGFFITTTTVTIPTLTAAPISADPQSEGGKGSRQETAKCSGQSS